MGFKLIELFARSISSDFIDEKWPRPSQGVLFLGGVLQHSFVTNIANTPTRRVAGGHAGGEPKTGKLYGALSQSSSFQMHVECLL